MAAVDAKEAKEKKQNTKPPETDMPLTGRAGRLVKVKLRNFVPLGEFPPAGNQLSFRSAPSALD